MVNTAYVKLWDKRIGAVVWDENQGLAFFEYERRFSSGKLEISPVRMPLSDGIYGFPELRKSDTFKGLPGLLADSLPDRYGNELINGWLARNGRPENSLNPVELLCFIGNRGMGALEFEPTILPATGQGESLELSSLIETTKKLLESKTQFETQTDKAMQDVMLNVLKMGTSAGGARPKAIIAYNEGTGMIRSGQILQDSGFAHWLIKFDGVNDTQFGETFGYGRVEMAYYAMAIDAGIEMAESRLIEEEGRAHFMTKRFDRVNGTEKLHMQTFCALQHYDFNNVASYSYEQLFQTMRQLRLTYAEAEQLFRRMVFNVLARNCDDHTKNFAFLMDQEGKWSLSPAYDICHAYRPDSVWVSQHCLSINGKRRGFERADFLAIAKQNSIRNPLGVIQEVQESVLKWADFAVKYEVNPKLIEAIDATLIKNL
ncbi:type II toxin-antitoxin system HipA family toxin [Belliella kenyensis]|uniref:Type II toxin-antitoxin system HipA family toxin n=1 Tax=Belliella kenyensis TaxID=1472724 RepID=A0ABV8EIF4_9BACT|nr:type II toxin-antitoxin system HipA family toxin [Belliella kenyensis]MCH7401228.1 type II toxin-antitoxin system HipA family toxin [Belliella kenyensis]MDN3602674.1 type II toxin-antitoxin system HipA family toxin [Belliella kenyensis]